MNPVLRALLYLACAGLIALGGLFVLASSYDIVRLPIGLSFIGVALVLLYLAHGRGPITIRQEVSVSGQTTLSHKKCPVCGAELDMQKVQVVSGKPYVECSYCHNKFEVTEEPRW